MKIALIKQETGYNMPCNTELYHAKIVDILEKTDADIIAGPEFAISNASNPINYFDLMRFNESIIDYMNGNIIIPGTALVHGNSNKSLSHIAPILTKDKVYFHHKKSSTIEDTLAKRKNLEYNEGDQEGFYSLNNLNFIIEIGKDHYLNKSEKKNKKANLEILSACNFGKFNPRNVHINEGIFCINDGLRQNKRDLTHGPQVLVFRKNKDNFSPILGTETKNYVLIEAA